MWLASVSVLSHGCSPTGLTLSRGERKNMSKPQNLSTWPLIFVCVILTVDFSFDLRLLNFNMSHGEDAFRPGGGELLGFFY